MCFIAVWSHQVGEFRSYGTGHHRLHLQRGIATLPAGKRSLTLVGCAVHIAVKPSRRLTSAADRALAKRGEKPGVGVRV